MHLSVKLFCLLLIAASLLVCGTASSDTYLVRIPLTKNPLDDQEFQPRHLKKQPLALTRFYGYYGPITIGNPAQKFNVSFATSDSCILINAANCTCPPCVSRGYDYTRSRTYHGSRKLVPFNPNFTLPEGYVSSDTVKIASVRLWRQTFRETSCSRIEGVPFQGIVGLGRASRCGGYKSIITNMMETKRIRRPVFSTWFRRKRDSSSPAYDGEILFGGIDSAYFRGKITHTRNLAKNDWTIKLDSITLGSGVDYNKTRLCQKGCLARIATHLQLIVGPKQEVDLINRRIGGTVNDEIEQVEINCSNIESLPKIKIEIGGRSFTLHGSDYIIKVTSNAGRTFCVSAFLGDPDATVWTLGTSFLESVYTVFDTHRNRVGFAKPVWDSTL